MELLQRLQRADLLVPSSELLVTPCESARGCNAVPLCWFPGSLRRQCVAVVCKKGLSFRLALLAPKGQPLCWPLQSFLSLSMSPFAYLERLSDQPPECALGGADLDKEIGEAHPFATNEVLKETVWVVAPLEAAADVLQVC